MTSPSGRQLVPEKLEVLFQPLLPRIRWMSAVNVLCMLPMKSCDSSSDKLRNVGERNAVVRRQVEKVASVIGQHMAIEKKVIFKGGLDRLEERIIGFVGQA